MFPPLNTPERKPEDTSVRWSLVSRLSSNDVLGVRPIVRQYDCFSRRRKAKKTSPSEAHVRKFESP